MPPSQRTVAVLLGFLVALTTAVPASAAPSSPTVRSAGGPTAVAGSYLVVFRDAVVGRTRVGSAAHELAGRYGGRVARTYAAALRGAEVRLTARDASRLAAHPSVAYVEQNQRVSIAGTQLDPPSWGLDRIDQRNLPLDRVYTYPDPAAGVHAYIIDTGVRFSHSDFGGRAVSGYDAVDGGSAADCHGHGTHVAGTVGGTAYGVAKQVRIVAVRVLDCSGSGTTAEVVAGVDWVTANAVHPAVANMSLGGVASAVLDTAVRNSITSGVAYGLAAGNDNGANACASSPGRTAEGITVGATTSTDARSSFSNIGSCLDIFAPGSSITSAWHISDSASNTISGTSMATPHVVGAAAIVLAANPTWTPRQVRDRLVADATANVVANAGTGSPNRLLYVVDAASPPPVDDFTVAVSPAAGPTPAGGAVTATISTRTIGGAAQQVRLSASGLPPGASASIEPATVNSGGSARLRITTGAGTPGGAHLVTINGTGSTATRTADYRLTVIPPAGSCSGSNGTDVAIPDAGAEVTSGITITGCRRNASATGAVAVRIVHTYRGDLIIDLVAPDGSAYQLKDSRFVDSADNVDTTYPVNLSVEPADGTWRLRVRDAYSLDTGHLESWSLTL